MSKNIPAFDAKIFKPYLNNGNPTDKELNSLITDLEAASTQYIVQQRAYEGSGDCTGQKAAWQERKQQPVKEIKRLLKLLDELSPITISILRHAADSNLRAGRTPHQPRNYSTALDDTRLACETALERCKSTPKEKSPTLYNFLHRLACIYESHIGEFYTIGHSEESGSTQFVLFTQDVFAAIGDEKTPNAVKKMLQRYLPPSEESARDFTEPD